MVVDVIRNVSSSSMHIIFIKQQHTAISAFLPYPCLKEDTC